MPELVIGLYDISINFQVTIDFPTDWSRFAVSKVIVTDQ